MAKTEEDIKRAIEAWKEAYVVLFSEPLTDLDLTIVLQNRLATLKKQFFDSRIDHSPAGDILTALKLLKPNVKRKDIPFDVYNPEGESERKDVVGKRPSKGKAASV